MLVAHECRGRDNDQFNSTHQFNTAQRNLTKAQVTYISHMANLPMDHHEQRTFSAILNTIGPHNTYFGTLSIAQILLPIGSRK